MFDNLYDNIGEKLKGLAKIIFIIEAIISVIIGLLCLFSGEGLFILGLLTLILGPFIAWISSWVLYAFGELVEKTCDNENNTRNILKKMNEKPINKLDYSPEVTHIAPSKDATVCKHKWRCENCNNMRTQTPCEYCGVE